MGGKFKKITDSDGQKNRGHFARLNKDGKVDTAFATGAGFDDEVFDIELQSSGDIIVGGRFHDHEGKKRKRIARAKSGDGSHDATFDPGTGFDDDVCDIEINDDKDDYDYANNYDDIIVGGRFKKCNGASRPHIERLNKNGDHDPAFINSGFDDEVFSIDREKRIPGINNRIDIIVGGKFNTCDGQPSKKIAKLYGSDGGVFPRTDPVNNNPFNPGISGFDDDVYKVKVDEKNNIICGGKFTSYNGRSNSKLEKISNDGISLPQGRGDLEFVNSTVNGATDEVMAIGDEIGGKMYVGGALTNAPGPGVTSPMVQDLLSKIENWSLLAPVITAGQPSLMNGFNSGLGSSFPIYDSALQTDGKILICTINFDFRTYNGAATEGLTRINVDGTLDAAFAANILGKIQVCHSIIVQPDGKILVMGRFLGTADMHDFPTWICLRRFDTTGIEDPSFTPRCSGSAQVHNMALQPDGKILFAHRGVGQITRLTNTGAVDLTFNDTIFTGITDKMLIQSTGKIILVGSPSPSTGVWTLVARLNADGNVDNTFTMAFGDAAGGRIAAALQADDKILYGIGSATTYNLVPKPARWLRLTADGAVDPTFNPPTIVDPTYNGPETILVQPDGKILVHEANNNPNPLISTPMFGLARYLTDGTPDPTFVRQQMTLSFEPLTNKILLEPGTGKIVFTGYLSPNNKIWKLRPNGTEDSY
ncbi:MAG: hypothetical protein ABL927_07910 [Bdellovibrionales bacterium]